MEQGGVFRRSDRYVQAAQEVLIPLEQGGVFRRPNMTTWRPVNSFNPFGAGRGLSTVQRPVMVVSWIRLNPFRTGQGLSTAIQGLVSLGSTSQSL